MVRKFSFVSLNELYAIVDRFTPAYIIRPSGLGVERDIHVLETDQMSFLTSLKPSMQDVNMTILFLPPNVYEQSRAFKAWELEQVIKGRSFAIEYDDGVQKNYLQGIISKLDLSERISGGMLERTITFKPLTTWRSLLDTFAKISRASAGKTYPFSYPYQYGATQVQDNIMENKSYLENPVSVILTGFMTDPIVTLLDDKNRIYNQVRLKDIVINQGEYVLIDSVERKIRKWNGTEYEDVFHTRDPQFDSFFFLRPGIASKININLRPGENGTLQARRTQITEL